MKTTYSARFIVTDLNTLTVSCETTNYEAPYYKIFASALLLPPLRSKYPPPTQNFSTPAICYFSMEGEENFTSM
jgi:hypothetical protein